jgi:hypothetical protein
MEEDHNGQAALRGRTGQSPADGHGETWRSPAGERIRSFTIITTQPNELCAELYNRMPAVLSTMRVDCAARLAPGLTSGTLE